MSLEAYIKRAKTQNALRIFEENFEKSRKPILPIEESQEALHSQLAEEAKKASQSIRASEEKPGLLKRVEAAEVPSATVPMQVETAAKTHLGSLELSTKGWQIEL